MNRRHLFHSAILTGLLAAAGCSHQVSQAAPAGQTATTVPAPFASPPVLQGTPDIATLVAKVRPSVVTITTEHDVKVPRMGFNMPFGFDLSPFGSRSRGGHPGQGDDEGGDRTLHQRALGSGFIVDPRGYVITNAHVVEGATSVKVKLADERELPAKVKGRDTRLDLALLEIEGVKDLPAVALGSSEALRVGEYVVAIGNPFGLGNTVTMGIVSAKSRTIGAGPYDDFIQTDASINPGNSGGPLFDLKGEVVGINTAINPEGQGIGFAIPSDALKDVLPQLISTGHVARGRVGVAIQPVSASLAKAMGLDQTKGALVGDVERGSPAEKAGIREGDVVVAVDDTPVQHAEELPRLIARHAPGTNVTLTVVHDKTTKKVNVTLDELKDEAKEKSSSRENGGSPQFGVQLGDAQGGGAVVQGVIPGSAAEESLRPGDVIVEVNRKPVARAADAARELKATPKDQPALVKVTREGKGHFVALERR
jgi:serine protease Do